MMVCPTYPVQKCQELGSIISGHGGGSVLNLSRACKQEERREEDEVAVSHRFVPQSMWPNPVSVVLLHYTGRGKKITGQRCSLGRVIFKYYQNIVEIKNPVEQIVAVTHYRKTLIRRVPESLPCVFYRAHGKERICRVSTRKHTAKNKGTANRALRCVPSPSTRRTALFAVCQPAGTQ